MAFRVVNSWGVLEPFQHVRWSIFAKIANGFYPFQIFAKSSILDIWHDSEYLSQS